MLNRSVIAAWRIPRERHLLSMSHLNLRREITLCLMKSARAAQAQIREPQEPEDVRHDGRAIFLNVPPKEDARCARKRLVSCA